MTSYELWLFLPSPELVAKINRLVLVGRILILVLFAILWLMVVKPGT